MSTDPRRVLEEAASRRLPCELLLRRGGWARGTVVRVEKGGIVVSAPGRRFLGGEDVRVWLAIDERPYTFEASVIRVGVPLPDRSQDGLLLGFIDRWSEGAVQTPVAHDRTIELLLPSGPPVSLLAPPAGLVELSLDGLAFTMPSSFKLIFVENGAVGVRLGAPGLPPTEISARVETLAPGEGFLLYGLRFEGVTDAEAHRRAVEALRA